MNSLRAAAEFLQFRLPLLALLLTATASAADPPSPDKVPIKRDFGNIQREVETLRGKKFLRAVPVYKISAQELRSISDQELDKEFPGAKLHSYEELLAWLDMVPAGTDLKAAEAAFSVDQVAGLYDSEAKEMCIPSTSSQSVGPGKNAGAQTRERLSLANDNIVLAHEFTHALEDQYWPIDDPKDDDTTASTDRGTAHDFVLEGSATREMIEVVPAQWSTSPNGYFLLWNLIHSGGGELVLRHMLSASWKSPDALVEGVPETLARTESMPYSFGYAFCAGVMRQWGLDGLDYFYNHPLASSAQVMHPKKSWQWRQVPARINLPDSLPGGWKQISLDSVGEAGIAVLFGCQFKNLSRGLQLARGWNGDHVALFAGSGGHRLLLWASSWDSAYAAGVYAEACVRERSIVHHAVITKNNGNRITWESPDGRVGFVAREGKRVVLMETDNREALQKSEAFIKQVAFIPSAESAARAAANNSLRRFNPLLSWQKDGDYTVTRSLGGLLSRHDRNSIGAADSFLLGMVAESRRTTSFNKWEIGGGFIARHESEARRGSIKTTWLPWGVLASHCSARLPQAPEKTITRASVVWGLAASVTTDQDGNRSACLLPFGILLRRATGPGHSSFHILGTGFSRRAASTARFHLFGIPIWTKGPSANP
jgi:hypothetical protein